MHIIQIIFINFALNLGFGYNNKIVNLIFLNL